jgi:hypothetical protein
MYDIFVFLESYVLCCTGKNFLLSPEPYLNVTGYNFSVAYHKLSHPFCYFFIRSNIMVQVPAACQTNTTNLQKSTERNN